MDWNHPFYYDNELVLTFDCNNEPHIAYGTGNDKTTYAHGVRLGIEEESNNLGSHNFVITPNPFTVSVNMEYELLTAEYVTIRIYDAAGRFVRILKNRQIEKGKYKVRWNCEDENGNKVTAGIYFCRFKTEQRIEMKKLIVVH